MEMANRVMAMIRSVTSALNFNFFSPFGFLLVVHRQKVILGFWRLSLGVGLCL